MECYLLTICRSSSLDRDSNNFSLMHLVESIQVPEDVLGKPIPLEMHAYYISTDDELNQDYEFRIVWRCDDGRETPGEINIAQRPTVRRTRTRALALRLPPTQGTYKLHVEWRKLGADGWSRFDAGWPLEVKTAPRNSQAV